MGIGNLQDPNAVSALELAHDYGSANTQMTGLMNNPEFLRQMSDLMSRPEVVDQVSARASGYRTNVQMIASNPQLAAMGPQMRQVMQSPMFRQMMSNPETLRMVSFYITRQLTTDHADAVCHGRERYGRNGRNGRSRRSRRPGWLWRRGSRCWGWRR